MFFKEKINKFIKSILPVYAYYFILRFYNRFKYNKQIKKAHKHYDDVINVIKRRGNKPIRFASYVVYESSFGGNHLMELMLEQPAKFMPKIVICPDVCRGELVLREQYQKTKKYFIDKYGEDYVLDGYDEKNGFFLDLSDQFDIIYCSNPYDSMVHEVHGVKHLSTKSVLPIYNSYGFFTSRSHYAVIEQNVELSLFYKYYVDTKYSLLEVKKYSLYKGRNAVLSGYLKMDDLDNYLPEKNGRIKILISPHHTIKGENETLQLSNFLTYYKFILHLPELYKNIDFVFRPHPLLFTNIVNKGIWTKDQVNEYINDLCKVGIEYSSGGDYFQLFTDCDAIIHDCCSFMVEWLYTGKPCCFVVNDDRKLNNQVCYLGRKALDCHFKAHDENEICSFIDQIVNNDKFEYKKNTILDNIMINYPNASSFVLNDIFDSVT